LCRPRVKNISFSIWYIQMGLKLRQIRDNKNKESPRAGRILKSYAGSCFARQNGSHAAWRSEDSSSTNLATSFTRSRFSHWSRFSRAREGEREDREHVIYKTWHSDSSESIKMERPPGFAQRPPRRSSTNARTFILAVKGDFPTTARSFHGRYHSRESGWDRKGSETRSCDVAGDAGGAG